MLISLIGGVIGIALGIVGALLVGKFGALPVALNGQVVGAGGGLLDRDRPVLRLLPGAQGLAAGSDRGAAAAVAPALHGACRARMTRGYARGDASAEPPCSLPVSLLACCCSPP